MILFLPMKKVAVIGTGIMGHGIADNFLQKGYKVFVWNRHKDKLKNLIQKGAIITATPKEATEKADLIFEVTANDQSSRSVWLGENGILSGASPQKMLITCATLSIDWTDELADLCVRKRLTFFDMPMTGSRIGAETGRLILMVGGKKEKLKKLTVDLKTISEKVLYFGKAGSGMRFKLLLNTLQAIHVVAFGEVLKIAEKAGLNIKAVGEALSERPGGLATNLAWRNYRKVPAQTNFALQWMAKDVKYTKKLSQKLAPTPLLDTMLKKFRKALSQKLGSKDWTIINKII